MRLFSAIALTFALVASPAIAGDVFSGGDHYGPRQPSGYTADIGIYGVDGYIRETTAENYRRYQQLVEEGGCNAPLVPYEYAVSCGTSDSFRWVFGGEPHGQMGSSGGE
jgi:hypothetical protein